MRTELVICEKTYNTVELTFGNLRKLSRMGIDPMNISANPLDGISGYVALMADCSLDEADKLIDEHIDKGGDVNEIVDTFADAIGESGFFQQILGIQKKAKPKKK